MKTTFPATLAIKTKEGVFRAHYSALGLAQLDFPAARKIAAPLSTSDSQIHRWHVLTTGALERALQGKVPEKLPPLDLSGGTEFQRKVWAALQKIRLGKTETSTQIAASVGKPKAARAVGSGCGANPIPVLIPCHRVLAIGGKLGGFSGGLEWKRKLLACENSLPLAN
jgi:O-6-methylguanine DNA methyltransferase